jgi:CheY-like chemotaxis protein
VHALQPNSSPSSPPSRSTIALPCPNVRLQHSHRHEQVGFDGAALSLNFSKSGSEPVDHFIGAGRIKAGAVQCCAKFSGSGWPIINEAEDGAAGLKSFTHYHPDIVITDWAMPILDGLELTQMIRQPRANSNPYVAIIMLAGHSDKKRVTSARDAGITEFLAKPISAKGLYQRVIKVIANPRPFIKTKNYFGPERRKGGKADVIRPVPLLDKARTPGLTKA